MTGVVWDNQRLRIWSRFLSCARSVEAAKLSLHLVIFCISAGFAFESENIFFKEKSTSGKHRRGNPLHYLCNIIQTSQGQATPLKRQFW